MGYYPKTLESFRTMTYDSLLYCKTNIGGYFFVFFLNVNVTSQLEMTSHPVETGSAISDHSYMQPKEVSMTIIMSDVHDSLVPGQFEGSWSRSIKAYEILKKIQEERVPVAVLTRIGLFNNMVIKTLSVDDTEKEVWGLRCNVTLVELPVARVRTVEISLADQTTIETEIGNIMSVYPTEQELESVLSMIAGMWSTYWGS